jgi:hypothetical protein
VHREGESRRLRCSRGDAVVSSLVAFVSSSFLTLDVLVLFSLFLATIAHVIESWEALKRTKNYEEFAGKILFQT